MRRFLRPTWLALFAVLAVVAGWNIHPVRARILGWANLDPAAYDRLSEIVSEQARARALPGPARTRLDESTVRQIFALKRQHQQYDRFCFFHARPDLELIQPWEEHPRKQFKIVTNSLGLRSDNELLPEPPDLRILALGDSHIAGLCANSECFAARLQKALQRTERKRTIEVINAANAAYSFYHYLGAWERMRALGVTPDLTIQVVYGGNDFLGGAYLWHFFNGVPRPEQPRDERALKEEATRRFPAPMGQVLNSASYFRRAGSRSIDRALDIGLEVTLELARQCAEAGSELMVAYLPAPTELPRQADLTELEKAVELLGLAQADLDVIGTMGDLFLLLLEERGIAAIDLRPALRDAQGPLYWKKDLHLNLEGQRAAAQALVPWVKAFKQRSEIAEGTPPRPRPR